MCGADVARRDPQQEEKERTSRTAEILREPFNQERMKREDDERNESPSHADASPADVPTFNRTCSTKAPDWPRDPPPQVASGEVQILLQGTVL